MRFFVPGPLVAHSELALPDSAARHAQVRRLQPGSALVVFDGSGRDWPATVTHMGRTRVVVQLAEPVVVDRELPLAVTIALVMPANERMDALVEKATELGVAAIQPLHGERSVLRLAPERAERKCAHWQAVAAAACEQSGRAVVPVVHPVAELQAWLPALPEAPAGQRWLLSLADGAAGPAALQAPAGSLVTLSGPEGGLAPAEEAAARAAHFVPVDLGPRVLRADTAPLALLAWLSLCREPMPRSG
jgi:16S rRNA (uracil1498-N3)-methyltransferase